MMCNKNFYFISHSCKYTIFAVKYKNSLAHCEMQNFNRLITIFVQIVTKFSNRYKTYGTRRLYIQ